MKLYEFIHNKKLVKPINEGSSFTKEDINKIVRDNEIMMGFEMEFVANGDLEDDDSLEEVAGELSKVLGKTVNPNPQHREKDKNKWYLDFDVSMAQGTETAYLRQWQNRSTDEYNKNPHTGFELVSPVLTIEEGLKYIKTAFDWLSDSEYFTNDKAGFHITMHYVSPSFTKDNLDPVKLLMLLGEQHLLKKFARETNHYAKSHSEELANMVRLNYEDFMTNKRKIRSLISKLTDNIAFDKYYSFNYKKLQEDGILEYRIIGNANYEKKFDDIRRVALKYAFILKISCDPDSFKNEYYKKVYRFIQESLYPISDANLGDLYKKYDGKLDSESNVIFYKLLKAGKTMELSKKDERTKWEAKDKVIRLFIDLVNTMGDKDD